MKWEQMVRDERRVDRDQVHLPLPGARCDEAEHVVVALARIDELQRMAEHPQEPGAPAAGGAPHPDDLGLELLVVKGKSRCSRISALIGPLPAQPHFEARNLSSSDSSCWAYAR